jgi:hypothetical protein
MKIEDKDVYVLIFQCCIVLYCVVLIMYYSITVKTPKLQDSRQLTLLPDVSTPTKATNR